jgi:hypothetical protein
MGTPTQEELQRQAEASLLQDMKELEEEKAWQEEDRRCCTYEKFEDTIRSYNPEKDFKPSLLCGCACPEGSISIISCKTCRWQDKLYDKHCARNSECQHRNSWEKGDPLR